MKSSDTGEFILRLHGQEVLRALSFMECNEEAMQRIRKEATNSVVRTELEKVINESVAIRLRIENQLRVS